MPLYTRFAQLLNPVKTRHYHVMQSASLTSGQCAWVVTKRVKNGTKNNSIIEGWCRAGDFSLANNCSHRVHNFASYSAGASTFTREVRNMIMNEKDPMKAEIIFYNMLSSYNDGNISAMPSQYAFRNMLAKWHKSSHPDAADRAIKLFQEGKKASVEWRVVHYNSLLSILYKNRRWDDLESVYQDMISSYLADDPSLKPSMVTLKLLLMARSEAGRPDDAKIVLSDMISEFNNGNLEYEPDALCINLLFRALLRSRRADALENVIALFDLLKKDFKALYDSCTYGTVLTCIAGADSLDAWNKGLRIFEEMKAHNDIYPDLINYSSLLRIYMKIYEHDKSVKPLEEIERLIVTDLPAVPQAIWQKQGETFCRNTSRMLKRMKVPQWQQLRQKLHDLKQQNGCVDQINASSFKAMIVETEDPEEAENLLHDMLFSYRSGDITAIPNEQTFYSVLAKWHVSSHPDAAERSMKLFLEGKKLSIGWRSGSYNLLILILCRNRRWDYFELVYQDMISSYEAGDLSLKPNRITLMLALQARSEAGRPEDVNLVLSDMITEYRNGNLEYKPDTYHINLLLRAWLRSSRLDAAENAIGLFDLLKKDFKALYDSYTYGTVLSCIARSKSLDAWNNGLRIFEEMKAQTNVYPDLTTYSSVLLIHAKMYDVDKSVTSSEKIENLIFSDLPTVPQAKWQKKGETFCSKTSGILKLYNIPQWEHLTQKIQALKQQHGCVDQINAVSFIRTIFETTDPEKAEILLHDMVRKYQRGDITSRPSEHTFREILAKWHRSSHPDAADRSMALFNEGKRQSIGWRRASYCILLTILYKHRRWDDFESVYQEMRSTYKAGNTLMKPFKSIFMLVLRAKSEIGCIEGANVAFSDIVSEYNKGNLEYKPNGICINLLFKAWLRSRRSDAAENAIELFDSLKKDYKSLYDSYTYGTVLKCIAGSNNLDAWNNGPRIFEEMKADKDVYMSLKNYAAVLQIYLKLYTNDKENVESLDRIERMFSVDLVSLPQANWQEQGEEFCRSVSKILTQNDVPASERLINVLQEMNRQRCLHKRSLDSN